MLIDNIKTVYRRIGQAATRARRDPHGVRVVAATKLVDAGMIRQAVESGLREFGENRVQEGREKIMTLRTEIPESSITWHLIGHLQKNKAGVAVELFNVIHSVDSPELVEVINKKAEKAGKLQRVLIQVKLSDEESKYGVVKKNVLPLLEVIDGMSNVKAEGLMTIPPYFDNPELSRPYFAELRELRDFAEEEGFMLPELSMGMTNDFEVAIEEGATIVRIGTAIFGERQKEVK
ncbi:MAG: YggS family pyridoxal phosphate-dependent enzyme [Candidatus Sulfobium sp.]|jgi:pyridoxal phosphate enzyme (YggS family)